MNEDNAQYSGTLQESSGGTFQRNEKSLWNSLKKQMVGLD